MDLLLQIFYFIILTTLIVLISKYILVSLLRKLAETLNLKPKTVGNISGIATSVPELLTVSFSAATGLIGTSISNILSSNIINSILYTGSVIFNKNTKALRNKAIRIDLVLVLMTILIPILIICFNMEVNIGIVPIFILLFLLFYYINSNSHKLYLQEQEKNLAEKISKEERWLKGKKKKTLLYTIGLILTCILLFVVGSLLSNVLEKLCIDFNLSQGLIGVLLGFATSIPELITFFESQKHYKKNTPNSNNATEGVVEATNNLLSSNIINLFIIQSIGIIIYVILF